MVFVVFGGACVDDNYVILFLLHSSCCGLCLASSDLYSCIILRYKWLRSDRVEVSIVVLDVELYSIFLVLFFGRTDALT